MPLVDSPSFEDPGTKLDLEDNSPPEGDSQQAMTLRVIAALLAVAVVALLFLNISAGAERYGTITGVVQDLEGNPLQAEVFVIGVGSDNSVFPDANGAFTLQNVVVGDRELIVGYNGIGQSVRVNVATNATADVGTISVDTALEDG
ncbi:MAG: carboxypeptidase-like regulatory domain-containing protein [Chloroflexota bacterium]